MVNLQLTAISNGPCGDSETATENCAADSCPNITVTGMGDQDLCAGSGSSVLALTATQTGGTGGGVFSFFGTGVTDNAGVFSFDADATGPGSYQINVRYDEGPCAGLDSFSITVTETPTSNFTLNGVEGPLTVCAGDDFGVAYVGPLTVADGATFDWEFAGAAATPLAAFENYTLNFATAGLYTLELTVTDNGCTSTTTRYEVRVEEPLMPPVITCTGSDLNSVTFSWDPVPGAADYELGDGTVLPGGQTSLTITGLLPGQDTTITLTARGPGVCGNAAPATSPSCSAEVCPTLTLDASGLMREVCLENGNEIIDLAAVLVTGGTGNGSYDFTGPGVTGTIFSAADAGGTETGTVHTVTVDYVEEGPCTFSGNFDLTVFSPPTATISAPAPACSNIGVQLTVGGFAGIMNNDITIDFDGGTVLDDGDATDNVYLVSWPTPGTKTVTAIVVRLPSSCASLPVTREVMIGEPLATPVVNCPPTAALESITFTWNAVPNALGYQVTLSSGETVTLDAATTSFLADGLDPETTVSISVVALGDGPCGNSESGQAVCETAPCPPGNVRAVTQDAAFCLDGNQSAFLLEAELNQGTPAGPFVWSGTGVVANGDGTFNFDPTGLGAGTYVLTVDYLGEANCSSSDNVTIELFDQPSSAFTATETLVCAGTETLVRVADAVDPTATYTWDFAGASQTAGPTTESYNLSWPSAGEYPVSLMVTANGCSATSTVMVTVESPADAGTPTGEVPEFCAGSAATINLNTLLVGQDAGGTWIVAANSPSSAGGVNISTGVFDGSQLSAGDYVFAYSVASGICPAATTEVSLRILAPPVADAGPPQLLTCTMGMATLDGTGSESGVGYTYRWFATDPEIVISGGDQPTLDVSQPGTYFLEVTNAIGCSNTAEVTVNAETDAPVMEVELRNVTCFGANDGTILVTNVRGGRPPFTFNLNGQDRGQTTSFAGLMAQEYSLRVTDANGCFSDLMLDLTEPEELNVQLQFSGDGTEVVVGDEITINAVVTGGGTLDTLIWAPDSIRIGGAPNTVTLTATQTQTIAVTVVDEFGCRATDRELLLVRREYPAYFPSAFSPNGDGTNDTFIIQGRPNMRVTSLTIYDRWGAEVHRGEDQTPGSLEHAWDGFVRGEEAAAGVYLYVAQVEFFDGTNQTFSGELLLLK
jgi:gliding motility-associated-like protein